MAGPHENCAPRATSTNFKCRNWTFSSATSGPTATTNDWSQHRSHQWTAATRSQPNHTWTSKGHSTSIATHVTTTNRAHTSRTSGWAYSVNTTTHSHQNGWSVTDRATNAREGYTNQHCFTVAVCQIGPTGVPTVHATNATNSHVTDCGSRSRATSVKTVTSWTIHATNRPGTTSCLAANSTASFVYC